LKAEFIPHLHRKFSLSALQAVAKRFVARKLANGYVSHNENLFDLYL
jgi:hypothetical protein